VRRKEYPFRVGLGVFLPERRLEICFSFVRVG
jgi:hypothetical protein